MARKGENAAVDETNETETATPANTNKRQTKASVGYSPAAETPTDEQFNSPTEDSGFIHVDFADGTKRSIDVMALPENVRKCATLQGIVTRFQRAYQTLKEVDKVIEAFDETMADLENGVWIEFASGEPKVTQLANAVVMALESKGETVDDDRKASIIEKLKNSDFAAKAKENPQVMANLAKLQLEAAQRRADERMKAAEGSTAELSDF